MEPVERRPKKLSISWPQPRSYARLSLLASRRTRSASACSADAGHSRHCDGGRQSRRRGPAATATRNAFSVSLSTALRNAPRAGLSRS